MKTNYRKAKKILKRQLNHAIYMQDNHPLSGGFARLVNRIKCELMLLKKDKSWIFKRK